MALPKGTTIQGLDDTCHFDLEDESTWNNWYRIPVWIQEKIKKAENYESTGLNKFVENYEEFLKEQENNASTDGELLPADDLPF